MMSHNDIEAICTVLCGIRPVRIVDRDGEHSGYASLGDTNQSPGQGQLIGRNIECSTAPSQIRMASSMGMKQSAPPHSAGVGWHTLRERSPLKLVA